MKEGWEYKKFKDICHSISDGDWIEKKDQSNSGIRLIQTGNIGVGKFIPKDDSQKFITEDTFKRLRCCEIFEGDVLISRLPNPLGRSCILPKLNTRCITAVDCSILKINKKVILPDFFIYYTQSQGYFSKIDSESSGTTRARITRKKLEQTEILIPPLSEQQSIVDYLDSAFAKIDAMKANAEKALNEAKALFQASLKKMLEPKAGWEEKKVKDVCRVINGRAYLQPEMLKEGKYKILRVGNFFTNGSWYYSDMELDEDKYCDNGDLLYAWSASFGPRIWNGGKVIYHYHIWKMVCNDILFRDFMFYWLDSDGLKKQAMTNLHGATMNHITKGIMENCIISFPTISEQKNIAKTLDSLKSKVDRLQENFDKISQECDALKQAILRQVFE